MDAGFVIIGGLTVISALAAMSLRNLVHCALSLTITFASLAALYLKLNAQFVGLAQVRTGNDRARQGAVRDRARQ